MGDRHRHVYTGDLPKLSHDFLLKVSSFSPLKPVLKFKSTKYNHLLQPALGQNRLIKNTTYFYHHLNTRSVGVLMMFNYHLYI